MKNKNKLLRKGRFASLFCLMALIASLMAASPAYASAAKKKSSASTATVKNTYATPDFAFPKTVAKNAEAEYERARKSGNGLEMIRAAIQLDLAAAQISADSFPVAIARFEDIASSAKAPYSNLALLLEARLYSDIYSSKPYVFDNRSLPISPLPENVMEWSAPMFRNKVSELVDKALSDNNSVCATIPLAEIKPILKNADDAIKAGFSVLDFMSLQGCGIMSSFRSGRSEAVIPFGAKSAASDSPRFSDLGLKIINAAVSRHSSDGNKFIYAFFCKKKLDVLTGDARKKWLDECLSLFADTDLGAPFVSEYCDGLDEQPVKNPDGDPVSDEEALKLSNAEARKKFEMLTDYKKRFPDAYGIGDIESMIMQLSTPEVSVSFGSQLLPGRENKVTVTGKNLYTPYVLVFKLKGKDSDRGWTYSDVLSGGTLVQSIPVNAPGATPDAYKLALNVKPLAPGYYAFVPSKTADASGIFNKTKNSYLSTTIVSDLSIITTQSNSNKSGYLYVVSAVNQKPVAGTKVTMTTLKNGKKGIPIHAETDSEGKVSLPDGQVRYTVEYNGNTISGSNYSYGSYDVTREIVRGGVLTDLSVYHPGDTVGFTSVVYVEKTEEKDMHVAAARKFRVFLKDANYQNVDTLDVTTDAFGRFDGRFRIPDSGLLGSWNVEVVDPEKDNWVASSSIQVADYKSPTFYVTLDSASDSYKPGDVLSFSGKSSTYAGMPVEGGKVSYTVRYQPLWWWRSGSENAQYGGETITGANGSFTISLPTENLKNTRYAVGSYVLNVSVTDAAGETQEAPALRFSLGDALRIASSVPSSIAANTDSLSYKVTVYDMSDHPVVRKLYYDFSAGGKSVLAGEFDSPVMKIATKSLISGQYRLRIALNPDFRSDDTAAVVSDSVTVWRDTDKVPPVKTALWVPVTNVTVPAGVKSVDIKVGSSFDDSYILAYICDSRKFLRSEWLRVSNGFVKVRVDAPADNERVYVSLIAERDLSRENTVVTVTPYVQTIPLNIEAETFRNRITPGAPESWKFRFSYDGKSCPSLPAMAVMSNKALNAIAPFQWAFNPYSQLYWTASSRLDWQRYYPVSNSGSLSVNGKITPYKPFQIPTFDTYGSFSLYSHLYIRGGGMNYKLTARSAGAVVRESAAEDEIFMADAVEEEAVAEPLAKQVNMDLSVSEAGNSAQDSGADEIPLRKVDCPLAFFRPSLVTDASGNATVDFTAPDFVGTWQFQILGYTPDMKGSVLTLDAVSAKKVMAQLNAPRFVRTGDKVSVSATLFNNTDAEEKVEGRIEILDALTGSILVSDCFAPEQVRASGSRVVSASFNVPSDIEAMTIRAYALIPGFSDGEQTVIPVLPSSAPVVDSTPFYIAPGNTDFSVSIPKLDKDAKVTLTYCDNPIWECVTALPSILKPESVNILSQADALFGNAVASGLFRKYPKLIDAVREMADPNNVADSVLYSPLEKNPELKTVLLNNTPWVNDAGSETMRMQSLVDYSDPAAARKAVEAIMKTLSERQNGDGGWSWCPEMKSSTFITGRVLHTLALLANMGYLPDGGRKLASKAFSYMDKELAAEWNRNERKYFSFTGLLAYLYDKSAFKGVGASSQFSPLDAAAMKKIQSDWRDLDVSDKALAAMLLQRRNLTKQSHIILESLSQFASRSPGKGMWFDNLSSSRSGDYALLATSRVLEAYAMIEPGNPSVDLLRQWLVVSKQTQNWGDNRYTAEVINAVLTSGTDWTVPSAMPDFLINGEELPFAGLLSKANAAGSYTLNLSPAMASGATLSIRRNGAGPAWGGVVAQYIAPILDVKAAEIPQLSVTKNVYVITPVENGTKATADGLTVGDRIRVTLTITCDRDLDYVAVTDPRAACLEPADQLSGYTQSDGVWMYREVRDESTNLFIPYLSKGTHVISYDCFADRNGDYSLGIATAQSQYAPEITAHSAGRLIKVSVSSR